MQLLLQRSREHHAMVPFLIATTSHARLKQYKICEILVGVVKIVSKVTETS